MASLLVIVAAVTAPPAHAEWRRVNSGDFNAYQWYENGVATDRLQSEKQMAYRAAKEGEMAVRDGATGQAAGVISSDAQVQTAATNISNGLKTIDPLTANTVNRNVLTEYGGLLQKAKTWPVKPTVGSVSLAVTTFQVGWWVGSKIRTMIFPAADSGTHQTDTTKEWYWNNSNLYFFRAGETISGGTTAVRDGAYYNYRTCSRTLSSGVVSCGANGFGVADTGGTMCSNGIPGPGVLGVPGLIITHPFVDLGNCTVNGIYTEVYPAVILGGGLSAPPRTYNAATDSGMTMLGGHQSTLDPVAASDLDAAGRGTLQDPAFDDLSKRIARDDPAGDYDHDAAGNNLSPDDNYQCDQAAMPTNCAVIPAFGRHELATDYRSRVTAKGFTDVTVVTNATPNTAYGPGEVTRVRPRVRTKTLKSTTVTVEANANDAPAADPNATPAIDPGIDFYPDPSLTTDPSAPTGSEGDPNAGTSTSGGTTGTTTPPAHHTINLDPLKKLTPCDKFPFGVPCWLSDALGGLNGSAQAPAFDYQFPYVGLAMHVDLAEIQPAVDIVRPVMLLACVLGLGLFFMRLTGGFGGSGGSDGEE